MADVIDSIVLEQFKEPLQDDDTNMIDVLWPYVAPRMAEMEHARKATLVVLASADDRNGIRGRCHLLMHGKEGTGKSVIRNWIKANFDDAIGVGPKSSEAGLKGSMSGGVYTPGALQAAHGAFICIDEFDEFDRGDRQATLEAMSEGEYDITQSGEISTKPAEVRVIAACNDTSHFSPELIDRFDFAVEVNGYDEGETVDIINSLYDDFHEGFINDDPGEATNPLLPYLEWVRNYDPSASADDIDDFKQMAAHLVREHGESGDIRTKESYLRIAFAIARLNRSDVTREHFFRAVGLAHPDDGYESELRDEFGE